MWLAEFRGGDRRSCKIGNLIKVSPISVRVCDLLLPIGVFLIKNLCVY